MKKLFTLLIAATMLLALCACGSAATSAEEDPAAEMPEETVETEEENEAALAENEESAESSGEPAVEASDEASGEASSEEKDISLTVTYSDETEDIYEIETTADNLYDAIIDTVELGGSESDYGFYIESVNGEEAVYADNGAYWAIYVNGEYGMYGVDSQPVTDGDSYALVYTVD